MRTSSGEMGRMPHQLIVTFYLEMIYQRSIVRFVFDNYSATPSLAIILGIKATKRKYWCGRIHISNDRTIRTRTPEHAESRNVVAAAKGFSTRIEVQTFHCRQRCYQKCDKLRRQGADSIACGIRSKIAFQDKFVDNKWPRGRNLYDSFMARKEWGWSMNSWRLTLAHSVKTAHLLCLV